MGTKRLIVALSTLALVLAACGPVAPTPTYHSATPAEQATLNTLVEKVHDYTTRKGFSNGAVEYFVVDVPGLGGINEGRIVDQCQLPLDKIDSEGNAQGFCERTVAILLNDPDGSRTIYVEIQGDGSTAAYDIHEGVLIETLDANAVVYTHNLTLLVTKYNERAIELYFLVRLKTGEIIP